MKLFYVFVLTLLPVLAMADEISQPDAQNITGLLENKTNTTNIQEPEAVDNVDEMPLLSPENTDPVMETEEANDDEATQLLKKQTTDDIRSQVITERQQYNIFPHSFITSLSKCQADKTIKKTLFIAEKAEIIGREKNRCHIEYNFFDLYVPMDILPNIHSFDDLQTLLKNKDIAQYKNVPDYDYKGMLFALSACRKKTDYYGSWQQQEDLNVVTMRGMSAENVDDVCEIKLTNKVDVDGILYDYSVTCRIPDTDLQEILNLYSELLEKYDQKRQVLGLGKVNVTPAQHNAETDLADKELMFYLQQKDYCLPIK